MAEPQFRARAYKTVRKTTPDPSATGGPWAESVHGVEWAEEWLIENGNPYESFVDLYFNGDSAIHTSVYYLLKPQKGKPPLFGIANSSKARWPVVYVDGEGKTQTGPEDFYGRNIEEWVPGDSDEDETEYDDEPKDGSSPEKKADTESKGESEEFPVEEDEEDEDENEGENDDEPEEEEWEDAEDDEDDSDSGSSSDDSSDGDGEEDSEMPRLTIFAKMRGPKGWRKRAESDPEREVNRFGLKIGVLDAEAGSTAAQERDRKVEITFIEMDTKRDAGELRVRFSDATPLFIEKSPGLWVAEIQYAPKDED